MPKADDPLLTAAQEGRVDVVKKLLARGGKPRTDSWKNTALHLCAIDGHTEVAKVLLAHGFDPDALNKSHSTPLLIAVGMFASPAFVRLLLDHGADATVKDDKGDGAVDMIFHRVDGQGQPMNQKRRTIGKLLLEHGAPATPEQVRRLGGSDAREAKARIARCDWPALEAHLLAAATKAIATFSRRHAKERFAGFCFDCNAQMHGDVLLCMNSVEQAAELDGKESKWNPGNWDHQEFANLDGDAKWRARIAPLGDDNGIEPEVAARLLESIANVAVRLAATGAFSKLQRSKDFDVFVIDHDETFRQASARMKRARSAKKRR